MKRDTSSISSTEDTRKWELDHNPMKKQVAQAAVATTGRSKTPQKQQTKTPQKHRDMETRSASKVLFRNNSTKERDLRRELAYQWYTRCGRPSRQNMKDRVCKIEGCDIATSDIDLLPWMTKGIMVDSRAMMKFLKAT